MDDLEALDRAMQLRDSNPSEAEWLWRDLAERGDFDAAYNLGLLLRERLPDEAASWLTWWPRAVMTTRRSAWAASLRIWARFEDAARWFHQQAATAAGGGRPPRAAIRMWRPSQRSNWGGRAGPRSRGGRAVVALRCRPGPSRSCLQSYCHGRRISAGDPWVASDRNEIRDRELRFRAVHRLSRLVPASDGEAWLAQLTRDGAQALQAGHKGLAAELMICRGILLRDWGFPPRQNSVCVPPLRCAPRSLTSRAKARPEGSSSCCSRTRSSGCPPRTPADRRIGSPVRGWGWRDC